ncbi:MULTISPECIES: hypothetical protein [Dermacoccus]|uniref:Integral membrane protein n=2 Tax=Dermacoccus TaxID=57495 RepID=A0ABN2C4T7_9MICO|nr:hypothetical protein [Dermacoccus abyssi]
MTRKPPNASELPDETPSRTPARSNDAAWLVSAAGTGLAVLAMLVMAAMSAYGVINGEASTTTRALTEAAVLVVLAAGVALLAINLLRHKSLAKTPTLLWNGMLVPVSFSLISGGAKLFGVATLVVAVVSFVAALTLPRFDPDEDDEADAVL